MKFFDIFVSNDIITRRFTLLMLLIFKIFWLAFEPWPCQRNRVILFRFTTSVSGYSSYYPWFMCRRYWPLSTICPYIYRLIYPQWTGSTRSACSAHNNSICKHRSPINRKADVIFLVYDRSIYPMSCISYISDSLIGTYSVWIYV